MTNLYNNSLFKKGYYYIEIKLISQCVLFVPKNTHTEIKIDKYKCLLYPYIICVSILKTTSLVLILRQNNERP